MAPIKRKRGAAPRAPRQTRSATAANATSTTGTTAGAQNATTATTAAEPAKPPVKKAKKRKEQKVTTYASSSASAPSPIKPSREKQEGRARKARKMPTATARRAVSLTPSLSSSTSKPSAAAAPTLERNVDNVVLGDILFRAWYPSRHVKEIVGREVVEEKEMLERLYVCKHCFKYSKELMGWVGHGKACERRRGGAAPMVPGRKIYSHGDSGWSVWEVDGEVDSLYCQNLCLFAKLFLDNKSVFFDVTGFIYLLLVHTNHTTGEEQVIGFFSKEKMSWDNNNLACILVFPPWQHKGLGSLLIAVSYEISRREKIIGGPEKPISDLGKMSYIKYWSGEVARYLLDVGDMEKKKTKAVTLDEISAGTWICVEDCLAALKHMNIAVAAGRGKGDVQRVKIDKQQLREWMTASKTGLGPVIDPDGFVPGYGYREASTDEEIGD
ncbi:hypothetical protein V495_03461 [Pseudogymnoascus sp. VKM F-4514 (FW-929)]|nr:hypothetical protein V490_02985 [Pseudogymnoascus sp. VKM F-3557]KFY44424.1 hypothetical protein V495_03461 [Pseudogymnoascus sp. VKM F-4514 (FW-929)]KFY58502.1 hypothetical protein V497_04802 [Pseudogymnoascus sp. VKM F-4516 (FW-969)]